MTKRISLSNECHVLVQAIEGVRMLADRWMEGARDGSFGDDALAGGIAANLLIVRERLVLLDRVVRDVVDPGLLWCADNQAPPTPEPRTDDDHDVVLDAWSDEKQAVRYRRASRSAKRRLRRKGEHR